MKKSTCFIGIIAVIAILITGLVVFRSRIIIWVAKRGIENVLAGSSVSIAGTRLDPTKKILLSDVRIKDPGFLEASIKSVVVRYSIPAVFAGSVEIIEMDGANITIDLTKGLPPELRAAMASTSPGFFHVNDIAISGARIAIVDRDLSLNGTLAVRFSINDRKVSYIDATINSFKVRDVVVEEARLAGPLSGAGATLNAKKITTENAVINDLHGAVQLDNRALVVDPFDCGIFDGIAGGIIKIDMDAAHEYSITLACNGLNLETIIKHFKLEEKVLLTGRVMGDIYMIGSGLKITDLNGSLSAEAPGGTLTIKDPTILENIAKSSDRSAEILIESLKDYEYTIGQMKLAVDGSDLALDVAMDGKTGKRDFYVVLHDIIAKKGGAL